MPGRARRRAENQCRKMNGSPAFPVYGIVTDGTWWQFGRLIEDTFTQNRTDFALANLPTLSGSRFYLQSHR